MQNLDCIVLENMISLLSMQVYKYFFYHASSAFSNKPIVSNTLAFENLGEIGWMDKNRRVKERADDDRMMQRPDDLAKRVMMEVINQFTSPPRPQAISSLRE